MSGSTSAQPPDDSNAAVQCVVEVYPYEGGKTTILGTSGLVRALTVTKDLRSGTGAFTLQLAPGGPYGLHARPAWTDLITPMSLVVIALRRGPWSRIVMAGIALRIGETEQRTPNQAPQRGVTVQGEDFQTLFSLNSYFTLNYLGTFEGAGVLGTLGLASTISSSIVDGTPDKLGKAWYEKVMAGPGSVMDKTTFAYKGGRTKFYDFVAKVFEAFPDPASIPTGSNFVGDEGPWIQKFKTFFPAPWYEFFVTTADVGYYSGSTPAKTPFKVQGFKDASPTLVARVSPLPITKNVGELYTPKFEMDSVRWTTLPKATLGNHGGMTTSLSFSSDEVKNYYIINPLFIGTTFGNTNSGVSPFALTFVAWVDPASVHRYGYRSQVTETHWMSDTSGQAAESEAARDQFDGDYQKLVSNLGLRVTSYFEPTPHMASGTVIVPLRPDIMVGQRYSYAPFRDGQMWDFYIENVTHEFVFGSTALTTLRVSRGLPSKVYEDPDLMIALHTGNAIRVDGQYKAGLPVPGEKGLQPINLATTKELLGQLATIFVTPQGQ